MKKIFLILFGLGLLTGCRSTSPEEQVQQQCDENRAAIEKHIPDAARKAAMLKVVNEFEAEVEAIAADSSDARKRYEAALQDYQTTDTQLKAMQVEMGNCLDRLCAAAESHSLELRKQCSEEEWEKITNHYHSLKNIVHL